MTSQEKKMYDDTRISVIRTYLLLADSSNDSRARRHNSPLQKRESTGASFLYWLDWKSKHFSWKVRGWKATQPSLRVFSEKLSKWEPCESCKIPYKHLQYFGLSTQSIQTLYFGWHLKSYYFAIFLLQILLFVVKTFKFSWSFIWTS